MVRSNFKTSGFTLAELLVSIVILGVALSMLFSVLPIISGKQRVAYEEGVFEKNRGVALGLLKYANESTGRLPAPFSAVIGADKLTSVAVSPTATDVASVEIRNNIQSLGVPVQQIYHDGSIARNVRVYQRVSGLTKELPVRGISGDVVTVTYDVGVIYQTECAQSDACNQGALPGLSPAITSLNYSSWTPVFPDFNAYFISTLDFQKVLLDRTMDGLGILIRRVQNDFAYKSITSAPNDITNWYMGPNNAGAPTLSGAAAASNEGCYDGWYTLSAANVNLLERYGLNKTAYANTAWGGVIQFCRDYDPALQGANVLPHAAAIRFNRNVTSATAPVSGQNIIIAM